MPANLALTGTQPGRLQLPVWDTVRPPRPAIPIFEYPVLRVLVKALLRVFLHDAGKASVDGQRKLGGLSFRISHPVMHYGAFHQQREVLPVEVVPFGA